MNLNYLSFLRTIVGLLTLFGICRANNICGISDNQFICCYGYRKDSQGECNIPVCSGDCGSGGMCIRPDTCYCNNGRVAYSCNVENDMKDGCLNDCNKKGTCINNKCQCQSGFKGNSCEEQVIDTCYLNISRGICLTTTKSIRVNLETCCSAFGVAWGEPCQPCKSLIQNTATKCVKGYQQVDDYCVDVDECKIEGICVNGACTNTEGSYKCQCPYNFKYDSSLGSCVPDKADICKNACGAGMHCIEIDGNPICRCKTDHVLSADGSKCVKQIQGGFNYCQYYGDYVCEYGHCVPDGSNYKCQCNTGYIPSSDGKSCKRQINYCQLYEKMLCENGVCIPKDSSYYCQCNAGYSQSSDKKRCTSVCQMYGATLCSNGRCVPTSTGDYRCDCYQGYEEVGKTCRLRLLNDENQGMKDEKKSDKQSSSIRLVKERKDLYGNYNNFMKKQKKKVVIKPAIDYCSYDYYSKQCEGGKCENLDNGYLCHCLAGFDTIKNGQACQKKTSKDTNEEIIRMNDASSKSNPNRKKFNYCENYGSFLCPHGTCREVGSSYECLCKSGYEQSVDKKKCTDINECKQNPQICGQGTCSNSPGSYQCSCYDGFTISYQAKGPECFDRNECDEDPNVCENGFCKNTWGSFYCECKQGFIQADNSKQCIPVERETGIKKKLTSSKCSQCKGACSVNKATNQVECLCPHGTEAVLNLGLCAPLSQVVDIRFQVPISVNNGGGTKKSERQQHIYFDLFPNSDARYFAAQVLSQYKTVALTTCSESPYIQGQSKNIGQPITNGPSVLCIIYES